MGPSGSNDGCWTTDAENNKWYLKAGRKSTEQLQSGAEMITARVYRRLGYKVSDTAYLAPEVSGPLSGRRRIASRKIPTEFYTASFNLSDVADTESFRRLVYFAAYMKDWDRLGNRLNTLVNEKGDFWLVDFGGTLGSRAQGEPKEDSPAFSEATGGLDPNQSGADILTSYRLKDLPSNHPWKANNPRDRKAAAALLKKCLTDDFLEDAVDGARYSDQADTRFMTGALKQRRDNLIIELQKQP